MLSRSNTPPAGTANSDTTQSLNIHAEGRVVLFVDGDMAVAGLGITVAEGAELDLFVNGTLSVKSAAQFGGSGRRSVLSSDPTAPGADPLTTRSGTATKRISRPVGSSRTLTMRGASGGSRSVATPREKTNESASSREDRGTSGSGLPRYQ